jgi:hypothetical protein
MDTPAETFLPVRRESSSSRVLQLQRVPAMTWTKPSDGPAAQAAGVLDMEVDQVDIRPDYPLNAVAIEMINPDGNGVRCLFDLGAALDLALRITIACARLRSPARNSRSPTVDLR